MAYPSEPSSITDLLTSLPAKFSEARQSGELLFFESTTKDITSKGRRFNVRCCPALQNKAKAKDEALAAVGGAKRQKTEKSEPFRPPYIPELYVGCLKGLENEEGMSILLNKYSLLHEHMLLTTPTEQPQSLPPTPHQLALAYLVLVAASTHPTRPRKLLAFYNGGPGAGASQTWRHLQFIEIQGTLPLEEWAREFSFDRTDRARVHPTLPYLHIAHPLAFPGLTLPLQGDDEEQLVDALAPALMQCLDLGIDAVRRGNGKQAGWNLLMTLDHLHLVPRSAPSYELASTTLELNSLAYAGMLLVKSPEEEEALLDATKDRGLIATLEDCGVPREWGEQAVAAAEAVQGHAEWS